MGYQWKGTHQGPDMFDATETTSKSTRVSRGAVDLKPCGTMAAFHRHLRHGEEACRSCRQAKSEYDRANKAKGERCRKPGNQRVAACGTDAGTKRHYAQGEKACPKCRRATNEYRRRCKESKRAQIVDHEQAA